MMKLVCKLMAWATMCVALPSCAQALEALGGLTVAGAPGTPASPALTQAVIRDAVRAVLAEEAQARDALPQLPMQQVTIRADRQYEAFAAAFAEAKVPDCLHADGLKRQPTGIGPISIGGVYALPFVAIAKLRGKCN